MKNAVSREDEMLRRVAHVGPIVFDFGEDDTVAGRCLIHGTAWISKHWSVHGEWFRCSRCPAADVLDYEPTDVIGYR